MKETLQQLGHNPTVRMYDVPGNRDLPGQGTVLVVSNGDGGKPTVYIEDRPV
jgi:hypothetical protein